MRYESDVSGDLRVLVAGLIMVLISSSVALARSDESIRVAGVVTDHDRQPIQGAVVELAGDGTVTDDEGRFSLMLAPGAHTLRIAHSDYLTARREVVVADEAINLTVELALPLMVSETITVDAVRAGDEVPVTKRNIEAREIADLSYGQDTPALLRHTPSMTWYSDSGTGSGYSYFSLRGISQTRINITLDGAPLNDPAEHALYFNNFYDLSSAIDSIQIQRGVGTSSVGSPSYGGSVNFESAELASDSETTVRLGAGSFGSRRASLAFQSGKLAHGLAVSGRVSYAKSDGYRERSATEHDTIFLNAAWQGEKSRLKLVSFSGRERSQLSFLAVDPGTLADNPRFNPLAEEERDRFGQDFAQLQYVRAVGEKNTVVASIYYNGADGWFRLWDDAVAKNEILEFGIDQYFVGSMVNFARTGDRWSTTVGVHFNDFRGDHALDVGSVRAYTNTGLKKQANAFLKSGYDLGNWHLFGDLQLRWAEFDYLGDVDLDAVGWTFVDPKIGVRYAISPRASLYGSIGKAEREPSRLDLLSGEDNASIKHDLEAVRPERVVDVETGIEYQGSALALQATLYSMEFDDEIAATGELSEVGLPLRINVDESYRRGIEVDLRWRLSDRWTITNSTNLSRNRIREWIQFYDVYDSRGAWIGSRPLTHRNVEPLLTPEVVINQGVEWSGEWSGRAVELAGTGRWVGESNLDNTGDGRFSAPGYLSLDLRGVFAFGSEHQPESLARPRLAVHLENLLNEKDRYPAGYSYLFINRDRSGSEVVDGVPYYYPLAGRSISLTLDFSL